MSLEDKERLEQEMQNKVREELASAGSIGELMLFTLENFSYRYLETKTAQTNRPQIVDGREFIVESLEPNTMEALKATNPETKAFLIEKAKAKGKAGIEVKSIIGVRPLDKNNEGGGIYHLYAKVECENDLRELTETADFTDALELRNRLAFYLEKVCVIF